MNATTLSPPAPLTAEEFARLPGNDQFELAPVHVMEVSVPSPTHGKICCTAAVLLAAHVEAGDLGHVMANDSWIKTLEGPDSVRGADVSFYGYQRLPKGKIPEGRLPLPPDLVIEVRSVAERWLVGFGKVCEYLEAAVSVVVLLDPATETASIYRPDQLPQILVDGDALTLPDVLPGFSVPVKRLFN